MSLHYVRKLSTLSESELESERAALNRLLSSVIQEYDDRRETIEYLVSQRNMVDNLLVRIKNKEDTF
jgi:hypothetical protein